MNAYATVERLKTRLGMTEQGSEVDLLMLLDAASRQIDSFTGRYFYVWTGIKYFDGDSGNLYLPEDLLSVSTFYLDEDGDGTYEASLTTSDYKLYPLNDYPKTWVKINPNGNYGGFASGILQGVKITGSFGYGDGFSATPYSISGTTNSGSLTATQTDIAMTDLTRFNRGQTILINSEQMYISDIVTSSLTVERGMNGTTAATHSATQTVYIYKYPTPIVEACLMQAARWWKRKDTSFATVVAMPEMGQYEVYRGLDADIKLIVESFKRY